MRHMSVPAFRLICPGALMIVNFSNCDQDSPAGNDGDPFTLSEPHEDQVEGTVRIPR